MFLRRARSWLFAKYGYEERTIMGNEPLKPIATPEQIKQDIRLGRILMPYADRQRKAFFEKTPNQTHARLIHYTTAENALKIINGKRIWMRSTHVMADYRE